MAADDIVPDYETTSEHEAAEEHETAEEPETGPDDSGGAAVLRNRPFLLLWLAQAATQIGGNMVLYGLTVVVLETTRSSAAVSGLILTFLVPAVLLSGLPFVGAAVATETPSAAARTARIRNRKRIRFTSQFG